MQRLNDYQEPKLSGSPVNVISRLFGCTRRTIERFWKQFRITESVRDVVGHVRQLLPMIGITIIAQHLCNRLLNVAVTER